MLPKTFYKTDLKCEKMVYCDFISVFAISFKDFYPTSLGGLGLTCLPDARAVSMLACRLPQGV